MGNGAGEGGQQVSCLLPDGTPRPLPPLHIPFFFLPVWREHSRSPSEHVQRALTPSAGLLRPRQDPRAETQCEAARKVWVQGCRLPLRGRAGQFPGQSRHAMAALHEVPTAWPVLEPARFPNLQLCSQQAECPQGKVTGQPTPPKTCPQNKREPPWAPGCALRCAETSAPKVHTLCLSVSGLKGFRPGSAEKRQRRA